MNYKDLDLLQIKRFLTYHLDRVTCFNCCKYYLVPTTATCGHSLCHTCWRVQRSCPLCASQVNKKALKLNSSLQSHTEHAITLRHTFESLFDMQLDDTLHMETVEQQHVKEWLASSENQFSVPFTTSQPFTEETVKSIHQITSEIQVHTVNHKVKETERDTIKMCVEQEDWDKIEAMPETETNPSFENPVGPMDIETFDIVVDDKDYNPNNPRRSSRNKELKRDKPITSNVSPYKDTGRSLNVNPVKVCNKIGQTWKNVKRMKKEFSKLNKNSRNKLNISIEMCKKAKVAANKKASSKSQQVSSNIDDSLEIAGTEEVTFKNKEINNELDKDSLKNLPSSTLNTNNISNNNALPHTQIVKEINLVYENKSKENVEQSDQDITGSKIRFYQRGPMQPTFIDTNSEHIFNVDNLNVKTNSSVDTDDIEITIKIGKTLTNICIKKKEKDMQLKINTDREVQTSISDSKIENEHNNMKSITIDPKTQNIETGTNNNVVKVHKDVFVSSHQSISKEKSMSTKKNTTSADTSSAHFEITDSEEKEFADHIENASFASKLGKNKSQNSSLKSQCTIKSNRLDNVPFVNKQDKNISKKNCSKLDCNINNISKKNDDLLRLNNMEVIPEDLEFLNDIDIFDSELVKEGNNIQQLQSTKSTPSAIILPTVKSKSASQNKSYKRSRDMCDTGNLLDSKKMKITQEKITISKKSQEKNCNENNGDTDSENINYDVIMSKVFANIEADIENLPKTVTNTQISNTQKNNKKNFEQSLKPNIKQQDSKNKTKIQKSCEEENQKCSENIFSLLDKEDSNSEIFKPTFHKRIGQTQHHFKDKSLTAEEEPVVNEANEIKLTTASDIDIVEFGTPIQDDDDKSVVEETPQKNTSFLKNKSEAIAVPINEIVAQCQSREKDISTNKAGTEKDTVNEDSMNVISISDTTGEITEIRKSALETPLTINKFVDKITYKSTPLARKSLNFNRRNTENNPEETMCPSSGIAAKTTQEKEFMSKAFEETPRTQTFYGAKQRGKFYVAGSCLTTKEQSMLQKLCLQMNWTYVDKYTKELTHLVVGVDENNISQRSVKYVCAVASSKWIVSFAWVEKCLKVNGFVDEEPYEALDMTGEPGPRRSRLSKTKLLQGFTFYCMEPFSIIGTDNLKEVLTASGGRIVGGPRDVLASSTPAMLVAEPESTEENRFIYLALELKIVPINYEWVLDCLGTYTLRPIFDFLLCPPTLLPSAVSKWPPELICDEN